jgi:hypothetical protein
MAVIKIAQRGSDCGGLVRYLFGPGKNNEHVNQRTIAGTTHAHAGAWDKASIQQVVDDLRAYARANPQSRIGPQNRHIWHAAISLPPGETLDDADWARVADEYMRGMGFDDPVRPPTRWTAVHHGSSVEGNDHIHLVMSMIRQDGTKVRIHNDAAESRKVLTGIEQRLGLTVLRPAPNHVRPVTYKPGEKGKATQTGHAIERQDLEARVRRMAVASRTEAEFARRLRSAGLVVKARADNGSTVTGYAVGFPNGVLFGGGKLGRDLSLPRLRIGWDESRSSRESAAAEWLRGRPGNPVVKYGRETRKNVPSADAVKRELADAHFQLASASAEDFPALSAELAGALLLAAKQDPTLTATAREVGRHAQTVVPTGSRPIGGCFLNLGLLMLALQDRDPKTRELLMMRQVMSMLATLVSTHRARSAALTIREGRFGMSQPDATDEFVEMGVTTGVTVGAMAVQTALQKMHNARGAGRRAVEAAEASTVRPPGERPDDGGRVPVNGEDIAAGVADSELRNHIELQMVALRVPDSAIDRLAQLHGADLTDLAERLQDTLIQAEGGVERLDLLQRETPVPMTKDEQDRRDWIMTATPDELRVEIAKLGPQERELAAARAAAQAAMEAGQGSASRPDRAAAGQLPKWRTGGEPMTAAQRWTLNKMCQTHGLDANADLSVTLDDGSQVSFGQFTKAQASGAISEFTRLEREAAMGGGGGTATQVRQSTRNQQVIALTPDLANVVANANTPRIQPDPGKNAGRGKV